MSDYNLHYWPVPFRGQFVRAVLAYAGKTWTESDGATISKLMAGPVADMPVPFMGPPMLIDRKADFAIAQSPAIVLYLGETLGLMPLSPALRGDRQDHQRDFVARIAAALAEVGWCGDRSRHCPGWLPCRSKPMPSVAITFRSSGIVPRTRRPMMQPCVSAAA